MVSPLTLTNVLAKSDRYFGTSIVVPGGTSNLVVKARVVAVPCPDVQWRFNGVNIGDEDPMYSVLQPCDDSHGSEHIFALTIATVTRATSGNYSAAFSNFFGFGTLPEFTVSIQGMVHAVLHADSLLIL